MLITVTALCATGLAPVAAQEVAVQNAWVRAIVPGQKASGAFMTLIARDGATLVGVSSPVAGTAEVHEMKMEGDIMKMRSLATLDLPPGKSVELRPGGYHLMLMDLKAPLSKGGTVALTLTFKVAGGALRHIDLKVPVLALAPGAKTQDQPVAPTHKH